MSDEWPDIARRVHADYEQGLRHGAAKGLLSLWEARLAHMVPHLLAEISGRDVVLTRVRSLIGTGCGLYDLEDDHMVPVSAIRRALDEDGLE